MHPLKRADPTTTAAVKSLRDCTCSSLEFCKILHLRHGLMVLCSNCMTKIRSNSNLSILTGGRHPRAGQPRGHGRDLGGSQAEIEVVLRHSVGAAAEELDPAAAADAAAPRRDRRPRCQGAQRQAHERD